MYTVPKKPLRMQDRKFVINWVFWYVRLRITLVFRPERDFKSFFASRARNTNWTPYSRVRFTISTFCMIWKDTIFSVISILNFFKSNGSQTFIKTKIILKSNTIVFDPFNLFVFVNICLLVLFKKFNMDITEKMVSFQIIQNVINVKTTLATTVLKIVINWK